jgi:hypothetical protein
LATNRAKREVDELTREAAARVALQYVAEALETLSAVMKDGQSEQVRVNAAKEILDRVLGKAREAPPEALNDISRPMSLAGLSTSRYSTWKTFEGWIGRDFNEGAELATRKRGGLDRVAGSQKSSG